MPPSFASPRRRSSPSCSSAAPKRRATGPRRWSSAASTSRNAVAIERVSRNLQRVGLTHDGALDVKDVLRYERLIFTTAAYDAIAERLSGVQGEAPMNARDVIVAPRITEKSMADALVQQYTFVVHPRRDEDADPPRGRRDLQGQRPSRSTPSTFAASRARFARRGRRTTGRQSDYKKAIVTIKPGQKIELGGVNYFEQ